MERIVYLKTSNGDDLVATLLQENDGEVVITNPLVIKTIINPVSNLAVSGFYAWAPIKQMIASEFTIRSVNIVLLKEVPSEVVEAYHSFFSDEPEMPYNEDMTLDEELDAVDDQRTTSNNTTRTIH